MLLLSKALHLLNVVRESRDKFKVESSFSSLLFDNVARYKLIDRVEPREIFLVRRRTSFELTEREKLPSYMHPDLKPPLTAFNSSWASEALRRREISVMAVDSSMMKPDPHIHAYFYLISTAYVGVNYSSRRSFHGFEATIYNRKDVVDFESQNISIDGLTLYFENQVLKRAVEELSSKGSRTNILLLDQSLNASYTLSWAKNYREKYVDLLKERVEMALERSVIPAGVFYTNSDDLTWYLYRSLACDKPCIGCEDVACEKAVLRDKIVVDAVLRPGERTPVFRVRSKALDGKLRLMAFYLKAGRRNIMRVEFPEEALDALDEIYLAVACQAALGNGYPLLLSRAHDLAVLTREERELVLREVSSVLDIPYEEMLYSRKAVSKRRPVM